MNITPAYRRDLDFSLELGDNGDIKMAEDVDAVNQSIYIILNTSFGEKPMEQLFGSNVAESLFENNAPEGFLGNEIEGLIRDSLTDFEPSIIINTISVDDSNINQGVFDVAIDYSLRDGITTGVFDEQLSIQSKTIFNF